MQYKGLMGLVLVCIALVIMSGCVGSSSGAATPQPTPQIIYVTVTVPATPAPITTVLTPAPADTDPILHRFIKMYRPDGNYDKTAPGEEYKFYPEGTIVYKSGTVRLNETTPNTDIMMFMVSTQWTGTWEHLDNNHYLIKMSSTSRPMSAPTVIEVTYQPSYNDKEWKTKVYPPAIIINGITIDQAKID
ncbi:MAG: hypothetical protein OS112_10235 [Methanoregula sp.]|nr:MAG: hypothetical protein OS112_10235 [Methanoregula sp.]